MYAGKRCNSRSNLTKRYKLDRVAPVDNRPPPDNNFGPKQMWVNPSEPKCIQVNLSEPNWTPVKQSEPKWTSVNPSEPKWTLVRPSDPKGA